MERENTLRGCRFMYLLNKPVEVGFVAEKYQSQYIRSIDYTSNKVILDPYITNLSKCATMRSIKGKWGSYNSNNDYRPKIKSLFNEHPKLSDNTSFHVH